MPSQPVQVELSPPHSPHSSNVFPEFGNPSHPAHHESSPPHTRHTSSTSPLATLPSHPRQVELSPPQTAQPSMDWLPYGVPVQSPGTLRTVCCAPPPTEAMYEVRVQKHSMNCAPSTSPVVHLARDQPPGGAALERSPPHVTHAATLWCPRASRTGEGIVVSRNLSVMIEGRESMVMGENDGRPKACSWKPRTEAMTSEAEAS
mmetsp:Transcript_4525/g.9909  ORF Transcript_4525/g.9909 Transcript_4525/m.9909 type:complete len:203 (+) Transcript_4525:811-1419(+)